MNRQLILQLWFKAYLEGDYDNFYKFESLLTNQESL